MNWQPIETAPKDGTRILVFRPQAIEWAQIVCAKWNDDRYAKKPRPFWEFDTTRLEGMDSTRAAIPTDWAPLEPPK